MTSPDRPGDPPPDNGAADTRPRQGASAVPLRGPTRSGERALAPDLARGFMLLLIALANSTWYLWAAEFSDVTATHPVDGSLADRIVQGVLITAVDGRTYPMFAFLFGYGMVQLWLRQRAAGADEKDVRALLRRRNLWLLVFGFVHAALLWFGDILGAYGFVGLVFGWLFLRRADRTLLVWAGVITGLLLLSTGLAVMGAFLQSGGAAAGAADAGTLGLIPSASLNAEENYLTSVLLRIVPWLFLVVAQGLLTLTIPIAVLLAFWAARHRILEEPGNHLRLLRTVAYVGIPLGWLGGLPSALHHLGLLPLPDPVGAVLITVSSATGLATGLGYAALFGLIAHRLSRRPATGTAVTALAAVGKRSLSSYLAQSVLFAPVLAAWGLGLGSHLHSATVALYATGVWLLTVILAYLQERSHQRGPAEVLLRRLAYRKPARG